jgi:anti-sigma factor RsiW
VAAALTARQLTTPVSEQSLVATIARDHGQWLHGGGINSAVKNDVSHWIATRVPYGVEVPVFPSARLRGGRIATIQGNQAAVMEYDLDGSPLSYFVLRMDDNISGERMEQLTHSRREGYEVVLWREPGFLHVLVGRISPSILDQLAMMCIEKSRKISSLPHDSRLES